MNIYRIGRLNKNGGLMFYYQLIINEHVLTLIQERVHL